MDELDKEYDWDPQRIMGVAEDGWEVHNGEGSVDFAGGDYAQASSALFPTDSRFRNSIQRLKAIIDLPPPVPEGDLRPTSAHTAEHAKHSSHHGSHHGNHHGEHDDEEDSEDGNKESEKKVIFSAKTGNFAFDSFSVAVEACLKILLFFCSNDGKVIIYLRSLIYSFIIE